MRTLIIALASLTLGVGIFASPLQAQGDEDLQTQKDKLSYIIGLQYGRGLKQQKIDIAFNAFDAGFRDGLEGRKQKLTDQEIRQVSHLFQAARLKELADKNKRIGKDFLAKNMSQKGVRTTASGMQYQIIKAGNGASPKATDTVSTHYRGTLLNGKEFDSSYKRGEPASFAANRVIKGWTEALQLMKVGAKWRLWIPSRLAYGDNGSGRMIAPGALLVFEVELLGIN